MCRRSTSQKLNQKAQPDINNVKHLNFYRPAVLGEKLLNVRSNVTHLASSFQIFSFHNPLNSDDIQGFFLFFTKLF